jgi:hypothetical protein
MRPDVAQDLRNSSRAFLEFVWPVLAPQLGGGKVIPVESVTDSAMASTLDQLGGIDVWHVRSESGVRGIGSRVQETKIPYASFTVRKSRSSGAETEWSKRKRAIGSRHGWLYPALVVQAYVADFERGPLLYACMTSTRELFRFAEEIHGGSVWELQRNRDDGNTFAVFWTAWLRAQGVEVFEHVADGVQPRGPRARAREATR